jgi:hypothetical protein
VVFALAATSIWCLLAEFYGLCSMRAFTFWISLPAMVGLGMLVVLDRVLGDGRLSREVAVGAVAGLVAAVAYDIFRLPFVFANEWGLASVVSPLKLFKVFPRFGAMILGEPTEQANYSPAAHLIGWTYHFSNGLTFGVMYAAMIGEAAKRHWSWAVVMAVVLEMGMLLSPYPQVFGIHIGANFVAVTLAAHVIFGLALGFWVRNAWTTHRSF